MRVILFLILFVGILIGSCTDSSTTNTSNHPYAEFYFPFDTIAKTYCYRDTVNGLQEQFKRVYGVIKEDGQHFIIETYVDRGRLKDVLVVSYDSLQVLNYSVVNTSNLAAQSELYKEMIFPRTKDDRTWFAAKYPGFIDSTLILEENKRTMIEEDMSHSILGEDNKVLKFRDTIRWTMIQPYTKKEKELSTVQLSYYAKGIGLAEFFGEQGKVHFVLEKIIEDEEWVKIAKQ